MTLVHFLMLSSDWDGGCNFFSISSHRSAVSSGAAPVRRHSISTGMAASGLLLRWQFPSRRFQVLIPVRFQSFPRGGMRRSGVSINPSPVLSGHRSSSGLLPVRFPLFSSGKLYCFPFLFHFISFCFVFSLSLSLSLSICLFFSLPRSPPCFLRLLWQPFKASTWLAGSDHLSYF